MTQRHHHQSSVIGEMMDPSLTSYCTTKNIPVYNRLGDQKNNIKQIEEQNRLKKQQDEEAANAPNYKMKQFENVPSKVWGAVEQHKVENPHEFKRKDAGKAISNVMVPKGTIIEEQLPPKFEARAKVNSQNPNYQVQKKENVNYFKQNITTMRKQEKELTIQKNAPKVEDTKKLGEVPEYLQKRKQQWQDDAEKQELEKQMEAELAKIPPGTRPVGDEERKTLLIELKAALVAETRKLNSFRIQGDNISAQKARQESIDKVEQLEKTISDFQRPGPLFIATD